MLMNYSPSLIKEIQKYFNSGPEVVLLPTLQWNNEQIPNFNDEDFFLTYFHIDTAYPALRDRMWYGLNKIAYFINAGISNQKSYFINCGNVEDFIEDVYECGFLLNNLFVVSCIIFLAGTNDVFDIGELDDKWQFTDAIEKLENFVKSFELNQIGLTDDVAIKVCPEANIELHECMKSTTNANLEAFYQECLAFI